MSRQESTQEVEKVYAMESDLGKILSEYRKKRIVEMLMGPTFSVTFHIVAIVALALLWTSKEIPKDNLGDIVIVNQPQVDEPFEPIPPEPFEDNNDDMTPELVPVEPATIPVADNVKTDDPFDDNILDPEMNDNMDFNAFDDIKPIVSALKNDSIFGRRGEGGRTASIKRHGGKLGKKIEAAVLRNLNWLKVNQDAAGYWPKGNSQYKEAMTGLALLCFMSHAETPGNSKNYGETVSKAIQWLSNRVDLDTGTVKGGVNNGAATYTNAIICYALAECYGMTELPQLKEIVTSMVRTIVESQHEIGDWRYQYKAGNHPDTSVAGWHVQALKAAYAAGCEVEGMEKAMDSATSYMKKVIEPSGMGLYRVDQKHSRRLSMGAVAGLSLQFLYQNRSKEVQAVMNRIKKDFHATAKNMEKSPFIWDNEVSNSRPNSWVGMKVYDWYYQTQVVFQRGDQSFWRNWNSDFLYGQIARNQIVEEIGGTEVGYWKYPANTKNNMSQSLYTNCLNCLSMQVYYRILPSHKSKKASFKNRRESHKSSVDDLSLDLI